jgi:Bacterial Ig-like domain (group 2)
MNPTVTALVAGDTQRVTATVLDQTGHPMSGVSVNWTTSAPLVATVRDGLITAVGPGGANITATAGGQFGLVEVTVSPPSTATLPPEPSPSGTTIWQDDFNGGGLLGQLLTDVELLAQYIVLGGEYIHADPTGGLDGSGAVRIDWQRSTACQDQSRLLQREFPATPEVYIQYDVRYTPGFIFDWTDSGQSPCTGNAKKLFFLFPVSGSGTSRFDFISENHTLGMGGDFDHPLFQQNVGLPVSVAAFGDGNWHRVTIHVRQSSTPTATDGFIYGWIDGQLHWDIPHWASGSSGGWNYFQLASTFNQGSPANQSEWTDNLTVWRP